MGRCCLWLCLCPARPNFFEFRDRYCPLAGQLALAAATAATATTAPRPVQQLVLGTVIAQQPRQQPRNHANNHANNAQQQQQPRATTARLAQRSGYGIPCLDLAQVNLRKSQALLYLQLHAHPNTRQLDTIQQLQQQRNPRRRSHGQLDWQSDQEHEQLQLQRTQ